MEQQRLAEICRGYEFLDRARLHERRVKWLIKDMNLELSDPEPKQLPDYPDNVKKAVQRQRS